jgi:1-acyl-sn-glycerol-3-phosphate acyltransferase
MSRVLQPGSEIQNADALATARDRSAVLVGNHLSYIDVNVFEYLMDRASFGDVAERLTTVVGPKVFTQPIRKLASLCFATVKLPQSTSRASGEAVMSAREVARVARRTIRTALERLAQGDVLLVFPEGSRSRSGGLERCLAAVARYLESPDTWVIPWAQTGCERLFPINDDQVHPATVVAHVGAGFPAALLFERCRSRRQLVADVIGVRIAALLPERYQGVYAVGAGEFDEAREIADALR